MNDQPQFFDFAAEVGLTKHLGGLEATEILCGLCQVSEGKYILDVGCGAGVTPCFIARKYGCRVDGVDILDAMIERSKERVKKEGLLDRVECRVADVQELPFEDDLFDAVISESVTAFPEDKQKAVNEYVRVTKPGGYVGLNESTWLKVPPPPEMVAWVSQDVGAAVQPLTSSEWVELMESAGLKEIDARAYGVKVKDETRGLMQRYGLGGMLKVYWRMLRLYMRNPDYREFVKEVRNAGIVPKDLDEYFGYGLYVGRK